MQKDINLRTTRVHEMELEASQKAQFLRELAGEQSALAVELESLIEQLQGQSGGNQLGGNLEEDR